MGRKTKGMTLNFTGKVGDIVGVQGKGGQQIYRGYVATINDAKSSGQVFQRNKLASIVALWGYFSAGAKNAFPKRKKTSSEYNAFVSENLKAFDGPVDPTRPAVWGATVLTSPNIPQGDRLTIQYGEDSVTNKIIALCTYEPNNLLENTAGTILQMNLYDPNVKAGRSVSYTTVESGVVVFAVRLQEYGLEQVAYATRTGRNPRTGEELRTCTGVIEEVTPVTVPNGTPVI